MLRILDFFHIIQHQKDPTKLGKLIDLYCINKPAIAIAQTMYTAVGLLDHDIPVTDCQTQSWKELRQIYNYKKAGWEKIKQ